MDLCKGDDLCGRMMDIFESRQELTTEIIRTLLMRMMQNVQVLHDRKLAHLDIKPENFVFPDCASMHATISVEESKKLKLIDLSGCRNGEDPRVEDDTMMVSWYYISPEVMQGQERILEASDVWALGVILYILLSQGDYPLHPNDLRDGSYDRMRRKLEEISVPDDA